MYTTTIMLRGKVLRVRIEIGLLNILSWGRTINVKGDQLWILTTYEKLPRVFLLRETGSRTEGLRRHWQNNNHLKDSIWFVVMARNNQKTRVEQDEGGGPKQSFSLIIGFARPKR